MQQCICWGEGMGAGCECLEQAPQRGCCFPWREMFAVRQPSSVVDGVIKVLEIHNDLLENKSLGLKAGLKCSLFRQKSRNNKVVMYGWQAVVGKISLQMLASAFTNYISALINWEVKLPRGVNCSILRSGVGKEESHLMNVYRCLLQKYAHTYT